MNDMSHSMALPRPGRLDAFLRRQLLAKLGALRDGRLRVRDALGEVVLGTQGSGPLVTVTIDDPAFYRAVATQGSVGAGESYIRGQWRCDDLVALVQLLVRNRELLDGVERGPARIGGWALKAWAQLRRNTREGSRRNIAAHYDLGNPFFSLFLSKDLMYSSALFEDGDTLDAASQRKLARICEQLQLTPADHVLEIGTGWGGFAMYAARHIGCRVTTTTISVEQHALASQRIEAAGLHDRVTLLLKDYRDLDGQYDKLVSIEMIEAIGAQYLQTYFATLTRLLKPEGLALLQAITIEDERYEQARRSVDYIKRFVFPGSFIPSLNAMLAAKTRSSDLQLIGQMDFGQSYALTLRAWRERFLAQLPAVRAQGFDEDFIRMWEFYLAYCEGGFLERSIGVSQLLLARPGYRPPPLAGAH
ncbi:cyclopropane-fatty-acyl-phospholipid synthase [Stenotrophomonas chelatiphaga]|uniref:Cyclopropane-fatty-acyl-phospholipid synthase n=1 Tax=Stenotrophomonas chelatiphaga TaxID=517011 RepID=A0A0R0DBX3_9GAMM|nr:cyclopropane-fatty-acyl-phospholipid synthase family protein [Stenotrophomonas chelatiphaga]KRG75703.1 cyclopropane-fatty-acyl-phospholipid synthase [Stenotrophomonas chelatiphaga]MCS4231792.1 cyclopropane-fatty-acyl-phospholipid synthase [Stenotrophomonas chelatiphaga]ROQ41715.1 cyclopropane-fatty-acyl-phospholipid synthase [Stenotrophomonas maltophilia]